MSIDERLDRLTERHEALAQSVEMLSAEMRELGQHVDRVSKTVDVLALGIHELLGVVRSHETRLLRLEGQA